MIYYIFWWVAIITGYPLLQFIYFKTKVYYKDKEDFRKHKKLGTVVISNHHNVLDFIVNMFLFIPRRLNVVAAELAFKSKIARFRMKFFGTIQADRNKKTLGFIDESVKVLNRGGLIQIFPEGHNTPDGEVKEFHPTYIMMALRANVPIIPVVTDGNYGHFKRVHLMIGKSIYLSDLGLDAHASKQDIIRANDEIHKIVCELREELLSITKK